MILSFLAAPGVLVGVGPWWALLGRGFVFDESWPFLALCVFLDGLILGSVIGLVAKNRRAKGESLHPKSEERISVEEFRLYRRKLANPRTPRPKPIIAYSEDKGPVETKLHPGIRIDRIPVSGAAGLIFVVDALAIILIGIPQIRGFFPIMVVGGIVGAGLLHWWRNQTRF